MNGEKMKKKFRVFCLIILSFMFIKCSVLSRSNVKVFSGVITKIDIAKNGIFLNLKYSKDFLIRKISIYELNKDGEGNLLASSEIIFGEDLVRKKASEEFCINLSKLYLKKDDHFKSGVVYSLLIDAIFPDKKERIFLNDEFIIIDIENPKSRKVISLNKLNSFSSYMIFTIKNLTFSRKNKNLSEY